MLVPHMPQGQASYGKVGVRSWAPCSLSEEKRHGRRGGVCRRSRVCL